MELELETKIFNWMLDKSSEYVDECGEFNLTKIAEDAILHFETEIVEDSDNVFQIAFDVSEVIENLQKKIKVAKLKF